MQNWCAVKPRPPDVEPMKKQRPFILLLTLLLIAGVLDSGLIHFFAPKAKAAFAETEADSFDECIEQLSGEQPEPVDELFDGVFCEPFAEIHLQLPQQLSTVCRAAPSFCSLGWQLPLRI